MKRNLEITLIATALLAASPAYAYIGPGPGLSMVGSFFTLIAGVALALLMVVAYPLRVLIKRRKARKSAAPEDKK